MPVRIYDLAKKLGVESKIVLAKAKDLNISAAKVPSSSLDKITAEFLEQQLAASLPHPTDAGSSHSAPPAPPQPAPHIPIIVISEPPAPVEVEETVTPLEAAVSAPEPGPETLPSEEIPGEVTHPP